MVLFPALMEPRRITSEFIARLWQANGPRQPRRDAFPDLCGEDSPDLSR